MDSKDNTETKLQNLYLLARRAAEINDRVSAHSYYKAILLEDPKSWEATFFSVYYGTNGKFYELKSMADKMAGCAKIVIQLIKENVPLSEQDKVLSEVINYCCKFSSWICDNANELYIDQQVHYNDNTYLNQITNDASEYYQNILSAANILYVVGDCIEYYIYESFWICESNAVAAWHCGNDRLIKNLNKFYDKEDKIAAKEIALSYVSKIKKYNQDYQEPEIEIKGCYIATAVYGSYDCPQVWTLRRFRDNQLSATWYGRVLIRIYYFISPMLIRYFGHMQWIQSMWRIQLDKIVDSLQKKGFASTPHQD